MSGRARPDRPAPGGRLVEVAVRYGQHGWPVLPLHTPTAGGCSCRQVDCASPGKHPRTRRGLHAAATDPARIRTWWQRWPDANIGVATGAASGLLVVDVDLPDGPAALARLQAQHGALPPTCQQTTGSGGRQLLFAHPGGSVPNRARLVAGIDVRGDGGYIVVPPSRHATGRRYRWAARRPPAAPPGWLLGLLERTRTPDLPVPVEVAAPPPAGSRVRRYATAALEAELARLASAAKGARNDTLNRAAFSLGQLVAGGLLDPAEVSDHLTRVATAIGLGPSEIRRTIASALTAAAAQPRTTPPPLSRRPAPPIRARRHH